MRCPRSIVVLTDLPHLIRQTDLRAGTPPCNPSRISLLTRNGTSATRCATAAMAMCISVKYVPPPLPALPGDGVNPMTLLRPGIRHTSSRVVAPTHPLSTTCLLRPRPRFRLIDLRA
jgi:hypothetical protein